MTEKTIKTNFRILRIAVNKEINLLRVLFCALLIIGLAKYFFLNVDISTTTGAEAKKLIIEKEAVLDKAMKALVPNKDDQKARIVYELIKKNKQLSLKFATNAYSHWYGSSVVFLMCSIVFGILTFLIAKQGWDNNRNFYLKASFLIFFLASSFFGLNPQVFNHKETGRFYLDQYTAYDNLQLAIFNLLSDKPETDKVYQAKLDSLLLEYKKINNIYLELRTEKVPKEFNPGR